MRGLFPEGIRRFCYRILGHERIGQVLWNDDSLIVSIGDQQTSWRLMEGEWHRFCTCGYKNDRCAHTYAAALVLQEIMKREGWLHVGAAPDRPQAAAARKRPAASPPTDSSLAQLPLFGEAAPQQRGKCKLEVEADFHHDPQHVTLRFYQKEEGGRRQLLRMQQLANLGMRARQSSAAHTQWSDDDRQFLSWVGGQIRRNRQVMRQNLNVLKLKEEQFDFWVETWVDSPGRFIERASQEVITGGGKAARMIIELTDQGESVQIAAVIIPPHGKRHHFHEVFKLLASGKRDVVIDGKLLHFTPPLSWDLMCEVFARKSPRMRKEHVLEHLPNLLEGRLDIVRGDMVERELKEGGVTIEAEAEGADILLRAKVGPALIYRDSATAAGHLREEKGQYIITTYDSPHANEVRKLFVDLAGEHEREGWHRVPGAPETVAELITRWRALPDAIEKQTHESLEALLDATCALTPELMLRERNNFVDFHVLWRCGKIGVTDAELSDALLARNGILRTRDGSWLSIDADIAAKLRQDLRDAGFDNGSEQRLFSSDAGKAIERLHSSLNCTIMPSCQEIADRLVTQPPPSLFRLPKALDKIMRPYQKHGFDFLSNRAAHGVGAILADDMGLGKTLQILSLLSAGAANRGKRDDDHANGALVICPASVVSVWIEQAEQFCPELRCIAYTGPADKRKAARVSEEWDVLVTNYALARMDVDDLREHEFEFVILDEAQAIKNPDSQISQAVKSLRTSRCLALTGTPIENRLLDLWSIMDFLNPGYLGSLQSFVQRYEKSSHRRKDLSKRIAPLVLRRTKEAVAPELPPRTEEVLKIDLTPDQRRIYDSQLLSAREAVKRKGPIEVLAALTRLRQVCCHPELLLKEPSEAGAAKLDTLMEMVTEIVDEGHSVLVFSQFTSMLALIEEAMSDTRTFKITGDTPTSKRPELVKAFTECEESAVFLLSLKAAGTGLTLTKADYVFIFDPWWNPAVERQAIDRTHRIGQDKPVIAYRLVASNTVEEKVLQLQREKAELFADVMGDAEAAPVAQRLTAEDIEMLLS